MNNKTDTIMSQVKLNQSAEMQKRRPGRRRARRRQEVWLSIASPVALLAVWELLGFFLLMDLRYFPKPSTIAASLWTLLLGDLWLDFKASVFRIFWGFLLG